MKLQNKKTGEVGFINLKVCDDDSDYVYDTIETLYKEWEDYTPKEPLIKDPKIRKAARAWAQVDEIEAVEIVSKYQLISLDEQCAIEFFTEIYPEYKHNEEHTIDELCGEEEE